MRPVGRAGGAGPRLRAVPMMVRWTLAVAGGFVAIAVVLLAFIYWQTALREQDRIDGIVLSGVRLVTGGGPAEATARLRSWLDEDRHGVRYGALFRPDGTRELGNILARPEELRPDGAARRAEIGPLGRDRDGDVPEIVRGVARTLADGRLLVLGYDIDGLEDVQKVVLRALGLSLVPALVLSLLAGTLLARRGQQRIAAIHLAVARITQGDLRERLPVHGGADDLDKVAGAVNGMLDRIERLVEEIRGVGDSIAHDLRTPLTRVRTRLERGRDEARTRAEFQATADRAIAAVDQALALVSAVLRIGEIEHGRRCAAFGPVDLREVLRDAAELYEPVAECRGIGLSLDLSQAAEAVPPPVVGDRDMLLEAIGNLVDNAIKFAPPGTVVTLSLGTSPDGTWLRVADRGPGIPAGERDRVLRRFYRTDKSRSVEGNGLGLSLVAAVVALHGFALRLSDNRPGCAATVVVPRGRAGAHAATALRPGG